MEAEPRLNAAIGDLASRLGVAPASIEVVHVRSVTWPNGALGCPEPGMVYTQALVPGYQVVLRHAGRVWLYHGSRDGDPFLCRSGEPDGGRDFVPPPRFDV